MFRASHMIALASLVIGAPVMAADDVDTANSACGGAMPELCQMSVGGSGITSLLDLTQDGTGESAYDAGGAESNADATIITLDANKRWLLGINYSGSGWTCPGTYDKAETDFTVKISNSPTGTIQNGFDSYQGVTAAKTAMLSHTAGVSDNVVNVQTKVVLDWAQDIPGTYSITVVYTMETTA